MKQFFFYLALGVKIRPNARGDITYPGKAGNCNRIYCALPPFYCNNNNNKTIFRRFLANASLLFGSLLCSSCSRNPDEKKHKHCIGRTVLTQQIMHVFKIIFDSHDQQTAPRRQFGVKTKMCIVCFNGSAVKLFLRAQFHWRKENRNSSLILV